LKDDGRAEEARDVGKKSLVIVQQHEEQKSAFKAKDSNLRGQGSNLGAT